MNVPASFIANSRVTMLEIEVDKHSNMLIAGSGATRFGYKTIVYADDYETVLEEYGDSELVSAFKIAQDIGVEYIFLLNIFTRADLLSMTDELSQSDFTYIVPLNFYLLDTYRDSKDSTRSVYYAEHFLNTFGNLNETIMVVTEKHASLFEDQDEFIDYMNNATESFANNTQNKINGSSLICVANNLAAHNMAHVVLAAVLCTTDMSEYPEYDFGEAVFLLDRHETIKSWAYFQNHLLRNTTVENLLNFKISGIEKLVLEERIIRLIKRELSFDEFKGKLYTEYRRQQIQSALNNYLGGLNGYVLYDYNIISVTAYKNKGLATVTVVCKFRLWLINSIDAITLSVKVEL